MAGATGTNFNPLLNVHTKPTATLDGITINDVTGSKVGGDATGGGLSVVTVFAEVPAAIITDLTVTNLNVGGNVSVETSAYTSIAGNTITGGNLELVALDQPLEPANSLVSNSVSGTITMTDYRTVTLPEGADNLVLLDGPFPLDFDGTGNNGDNIINGNFGDNILDGAGGVDTLLGGGGNDTIWGGTGSDTAVFSGDRLVYTVTRVGPDSYQLSGPDGTDYVSGVENFQFADGTLSAEQVFNDAPVAIDDTNTAVEGAGLVTGSVALNDSDQDIPAIATEELNYAVVGTVPAGLTFGADGTYSFDPSHAAYNHLADGATLPVVIDYRVTDTAGNTSDAQLTITVTGTNDASDRCRRYRYGHRGRHRHQRLGRDQRYRCRRWSDPDLHAGRPGTGRPDVQL